ncbi:MAG: sodium/proton-translocating pyrophosphatase, partial [Solobacterium sp.]|nr:sodium/proton-translocating pyrophosphatase [Solobacterium sp.]
MQYWLIILCICILSMAYVFVNYKKIQNMEEGTEEMKELSGIIREGANTFLKTEFRSIFIVVIIIALVFSLFVEVTSGLTLVLGAAMSSFVCILGMRSATYANVRTSNTARNTLSIGETVKVALCGGAISGLSVQAMGLIGLTLVLIIFGGVSETATGHGLLTTFECNPTITRLTTYS